MVYWSKNGVKNSKMVKISGRSLYIVLNPLITPKYTVFWSENDQKWQKLPL
jgi:hypothetical protein